MHRLNKLKEMIISLRCLMHPDKKEATMNTVTKNYVDITCRRKK